MKSSTPILYSQSQRDIFAALALIGDLYFHTRWYDIGPLLPRLTPLIIGQSGLGKTFVVKATCEYLDKPCLRITPGTWAPTGSRTVPTMVRVHQFVSDHDQGCIFTDEIEKAGAVNGASEWKTAVLNELFDLLDREPSAPVQGRPWSKEMREKLRRQYLIIGGGTWETLWRTAAQPRIGFGDQDNSNQMASNVRRLVQSTEIIAPELLKRFSQDWKILTPPTQADLELGAAKLGLQKFADELRMPLDYAQGVRSGQGARWLEEMMGQLMLHARQVKPELLGKRNADFKTDAEEIPDFGSDEDVSPFES